MSSKNATRNISVNQDLHVTEHSISGLGFMFNFEIEQQLESLQPFGATYEVRDVRSSLTRITISSQWDLVDKDQIPEKVSVGRWAFKAEVPIKGIYKKIVGFKGFNIKMDVPVILTFTIDKVTGKVLDVRYTFF